MISKRSEPESAKKTSRARRTCAGGALAIFVATWVTCCGSDLQDRNSAVSTSVGLKPKQSEETKAPQVPQLPPRGPARTIVYYLHGTSRCITCLEIEQFARELVYKNFLDDMIAGRIEWHSINYDVPENAFFLTDFHLPSPSLVLVRRQDGRVVGNRNLESTWDLAHDHDAFSAYVLAESVSFAEDASMN